jgi:uncharacterized protein
MPGGLSRPLSPVRRRLRYAATMSQQASAPLHTQYRTPAVRHLAWMSRAPQLIDPAQRFEPSIYLPDNLCERLQTWDQAPEAGPKVLTEEPPRRLGHYFERLYECLLEDLLGWEVLLKNQPIRNNGITLGELDFIVRNPVDQAIEHHEIAVKFYLGYRGDHPATPLWYGPNAKDRLDLKSRRLIDHQSRLAQKPETRALLESLEIAPPKRARIFMPGYLFHPAGDPIPPPVDHLRGEWLYIGELDASDNNGTARSQNWVPLVKPHWLGPWSQQQRPDRQQTTDALETVRSAGVPRLFAALQQAPDDGQWRETSRVFVVPENWPGV